MTTIALVGYFGHGDRGDDMIEAALRRYVEGRGFRAVRVGEDADGYLLGGGTILQHDALRYYMGGRWADLWAKPVGMVGCGVREPHNLSGEVVELLQRMVVRGVRGFHTKEVLAERGVDSEVTSDTALLYPVRAGRGNMVGLNLTQEEGVTPESQEFLRGLGEWCSETYGLGLEVFDFHERKRPPHAKLLGPDDVGRYGYVLSTRLHPFITAWMMGIPALCINYQFNKHRDFAEPVGLGEFVFDDFDTERARRTIEGSWGGRAPWVGDRFSFYRRRLAACLDRFLEEVERCS